MLNEKIKHTPSDIRIDSFAKEFKELDSLITPHMDDYPEFLLLLALYGFKMENFIPLGQKDSTGETHNISRTVHQRAETFCESSYGLITILDNLDKDYSEVINNRAFARMTDTGLGFSRLPNIQAFYGYLIGGIKPFFDDIFEIGSSEESVARRLYDLIMEDDTEINKLVEQLILELDVENDEKGKL